MKQNRVHKLVLLVYSQSHNHYQYLHHPESKSNNTHSSTPQSPAWGKHYSALWSYRCEYSCCHKSRAIEYTGPLLLLLLLRCYYYYYYIITISLHTVQCFQSVPKWSSEVYFIPFSSFLFYFSFSLVWFCFLNDIPMHRYMTFSSDEVHLFQGLFRVGIYFCFTCVNSCT